MKNGRKVDIIVDLQYGSTGKGLIAGWLATQHQYDVVVNANMPNAGHTYIDREGNKMIHKVLPSGVVSPSCCFALLGPGSVFDIEQLRGELARLKEIGYDHFTVLIHPNAVVLTEQHRQAEQHLGSIGSTKQGSAAAMIDKINRNGTVVTIAKDYGICINKMTQGKAKVVSIDLYRGVLKQANHILAEGAQGYSLGINQHFWPYTTSRECTPARFLSDMMIPINYLRKVIGVARVHPIRVGGSSGPCYSDQMEISWESIGQTPELTTVTKKQRRLFSYSEHQIEDAIWECEPDEIFLNFVNYDKLMADKILRNPSYGDRIKYIGMGPNHDDVIIRRDHRISMK